jgi:hypothetical protein
MGLGSEDIQRVVAVSVRTGGGWAPDVEPGVLVTLLGGASSVQGPGRWAAATWAGRHVRVAPAAGLMATARHPLLCGPGQWSRISNVRSGMAARAGSSRIKE